MYEDHFAASLLPTWILDIIPISLEPTNEINFFAKTKENYMCIEDCKPSMFQTLKRVGLIEYGSSTDQKDEANSNPKMSEHSFAHIRDMYHNFKNEYVSNSTWLIFEPETCIIFTDRSRVEYRTTRTDFQPYIDVMLMF